MTLLERWHLYERANVPLDATPIQREECRCAFYSGAIAGLSLVYDATNEYLPKTGHRELREPLAELRDMAKGLGMVWTRNTWS